MIAFGVIVSEPDAYHRYSGPGIRRAAEADSEVLALAATGTMARSCNLLLDAVAAREDLEALVILHPHTEIDDPRLCAKARAALADPEVAVAGCVGAAGIRSMAWWEGRVSAGEVTQRYQESGGGTVPAFAWAGPQPAPASVDAVDGFLLVLSPWAVRNVRFDEGLQPGYGYDVDYCLQVRARGRRVTTFDARVVQHRSVELVQDIDHWVEGHVAFAQKWDAQLHAGDAADVRARARRAEAERDAARAMTYFRRLVLDARVAELRRQVQAATGTRSWRATAPLRRANLWLRSRRAAAVSRSGRA